MGRQRDLDQNALSNLKRPPRGGLSVALLVQDVRFVGKASYGRSATLDKIVVTNRILRLKTVCAFHSHSASYQGITRIGGKDGRNFIRVGQKPAWSSRPGSLRST